MNSKIFKCYRRYVFYLSDLHMFCISEHDFPLYVSLPMTFVLSGTPIIFLGLSLGQHKLL